MSHKSIPISHETQYLNVNRPWCMDLYIICISLYLTWFHHVYPLVIKRCNGKYILFYRWFYHCNLHFWGIFRWKPPFTVDFPMNTSIYRWFSSHIWWHYRGYTQRVPTARPEVPVDQNISAARNARPRQLRQRCDLALNPVTAPGSWRWCN